MRIEGYYVSRTVVVNGRRLDPGPSQAAFNHSPDGFAWGYGGSGPAQLALAILMLDTTVPNAILLHQFFKAEFVAKWNDNFDVQVDVAYWINRTMRKIGENMAAACAVEQAKIDQGLPIG